MSSVKKILVLCPGKIPKAKNDIRCFTDVINFYLPTALSNIIETTVINIPQNDSESLKKCFHDLDTDGYEAIITLGLRYYSNVSDDTVKILRSKFNGLLCQMHDGSRLDYDPVDITFTFKNDDDRLIENTGWFNRHKKYNEYVGWAADPELNFSNQNPRNLRILVDHTNYGNNEIDKTHEVLLEIKQLVESDLWKIKYDSVSLRRLDSGKVVDVDFADLKYEKYDRSTSMPILELSKEHSAAHIFCVTHPESVGLVVLETATAGAFIVSPKGFMPKDRLNTVRHYEWDNSIDWKFVLESIDIKKSRSIALTNSWDNMANRIIEVLNRRFKNVSC